MTPGSPDFLIPLALFVPAIGFFVAARWCAARVLAVGPSRLFPREGSLRRRGLVALAGPIACLAAVVAFAITAFLVKGVPRPAQARLSRVQMGSVAERAGLRAGDALLAVDGHPVVASPGPTVRVVGDPTFSIFADETATVVSATAGREFPILVEHDGQQMTVWLRAENGRIGIGIAEDEPFVRAPGVAIAEGARFPFVTLANAADAMSADARLRALVKIAVVGPRDYVGGLTHVAWPFLVVGLVGAPISLLLLVLLRPRRA